MDVLLPIATSRCISKKVTDLQGTMVSLFTGRGCKETAMSDPATALASSRLPFPKGLVKETLRFHSAECSPLQTSLKNYTSLLPPPCSSFDRNGTKLERKLGVLMPFMCWATVSIIFNQHCPPTHTHTDSCTLPCCLLFLGPRSNHIR